MADQYYRDQETGGVFFVDEDQHHVFVDEDTGDPLVWYDPETGENGTFSDGSGYEEFYDEAGEGYASDDDDYATADQIAEQVYSSLGRIPTDAELKRAVDNWEAAEPGESYSIPGYDLDDKDDRRTYMSQRLQEGNDDQREADADAELASRESDSEEGE